ncbi:hypothetical protein KY343_05400 [Candidatus Woesearchaeota archaeon]|nr:hypothetical protein [Candidatus Woesearchaeota archaeon]
MEEGLSKQISEAEKAREENRTRITAVLAEVGYRYEELRSVAVLEMYQGHDVHAFYILTSDPSRVVHVQAYPEMSSDRKMSLMARLINYNMMMVIRENSSASPGNEHAAVIERFEEGKVVEIPYDVKTLELLLEKNVPELR